MSEYSESAFEGEEMILEAGCGNVFRPYAPTFALSLLSPGQKFKVRDFPLAISHGPGSDALPEAQITRLVQN